MTAPPIALTPVADGLALRIEDRSAVLAQSNFPDLANSVLVKVKDYVGEVDLVALGLQLSAGLVIALVVYFILSRVHRRLAARLVPTDAGRATGVRSIVGALFASTSSLFITVAAITAGSYAVVLPTTLRAIIDSVFVIALVIQAALWASAGLMAWLTDHAAKRAGDALPVSGATSIIGILLRAVVWSLALLLILDNLGFDITALIAGLGIGGIAIGLAAQNILGDLFASLSIVLDKPFEVGDFIITSNQMGTVERIGLKTTRVRSLSGEQIVISNADLLSSRIQNYKRMAERRVLFTIGVVYGTPIEKLEKIPAIIRDTIEAQDGTRFDRSHFMAYGDFSLNFETVYYVLARDFNTYATIHQAINLAIYRRFADEDIVFAYPTQSIHIEAMPEPRRIAE